MPYRWLPTALAQIYRAGIEPHEVAQALRNRDSTDPVMSDLGPLIAVTGTTNAGRRVTVFLRHEGGFDSAIVGAREAR